PGCRCRGCRSRPRSPRRCASPRSPRLRTRACCARRRAGRRERGARSVGRAPRCARQPPSQLAPARRSTGRAVRRSPRIRGRDPNRRSWRNSCRQRGLKPLGNEPETAGKPILSRTRPEDNPRFVHSQDRGAAQTRLRSHPSNLIRVIPAKGGTIPERAPAWGITPVPERLRTLGGLENGMLWSSLGLSLLVLVAGAFLVPALSLPEALLAILVGGIFGNALLGFAAAVGAEARVPAMVLLRAPLGRTGSYLPTGLNV